MTHFWKTEYSINDRIALLRLGCKDTVVYSSGLLSLLDHLYWGKQAALWRGPCVMVRTKVLSPTAHEELKPVNTHVNKLGIASFNSSQAFT